MKKQYLNFVDNIGQGGVNNDYLNCVGNCNCSDCKEENFVDNVLGITPEVFKEKETSVVDEKIQEIKVATTQKSLNGDAHKFLANNMMIISGALLAAAVIVLIFKK